MWQKCLLFVYLLAFSVEAKNFIYPQTPREPVSFTRFGIPYIDNFKWMENRDDPRLGKWIAEQNNHTHNQLKGPLFEQLKQEYFEIWGTDRGIADFPAHEQHHFLQRMRPDFFKRNQKASSSDKYEVDFKSDSRSDHTIVQIRRKEGERDIVDVIVAKWPQIIWDEEGESFLYTSDADSRTGGYVPSLRRHVVGKKQILDKTLYQAQTYDSWLDVSKDDKGLFLWEGRGDEVTILSFNEETQQATKLHTLQEYFSPIGEREGKIIAITFDGSPMGRIVSFDMASGKMTDLVPERSHHLERAVYLKDTFFLIYIEDVETRLYRFDLKLKKFELVELGQGGGTHNLSVHEDDKLIVYFQSYIQPISSWRYNWDDKKFELSVGANFESYAVDLSATKIHYTAHNGQKVAIWLVKAKSTQFTRSTPTYLYGYGGFRINILPSYPKYYMPFLKRGGVLAVVTLPGGLEYGEDWHKAGARLNKKNVFDDFASAAKTLISMGYTSSSKLAIGGASNGGLLVGATTNLYPELFRVALPAVGVLDLTNFELFTAGKWWTDEYGFRDNRIDYLNQMKLSPLHNLRNRQYPAVLVTTADLDDRVVPSHSYKYAAKLQQLKANDRKALIYVKRGGSHSRYSGTMESRANEFGYIWNFVLSELK